MSDSSGEFEIGGRGQAIGDLFDRWLQAFGGAWQAQNADDIARLFTGDATWFETPFGPAVKGRQAIHEHWSNALAGQRNVVFMYRVLAVQGDIGVARWAAQIDITGTGKRIEFDGVIECRMDGNGTSRLTRLWWHDREAPRRGTA